MVTAAAESGRLHMVTGALEPGRNAQCIPLGLMDAETGRTRWPSGEARAEPAPPPHGK